ncbi:unnamed protein product [Polarella glacialis]|uniref:Plastid lipid-associated protein/fibrillin conserved domain-containing protein n=1 Tax=Polarella glacialis TaxID=89957 RepID=A0A813FGT5_POLGL|nr:unnamed protein product [Polarella glacialis]
MLQWPIAVVAHVKRRGLIPSRRPSDLRKLHGLVAAMVLLCVSLGALRSEQPLSHAWASCTQNVGAIIAGRALLGRTPLSSSASGRSESKLRPLRATPSDTNKQQQEQEAREQLLEAKEAWEQLMEANEAKEQLLEAEEAKEQLQEANNNNNKRAKEQLLEACESFKQKQEAMWDAMDEEEKADKLSGKKKKKTEKEQSSLLEAESFAAQRVELSDELALIRNETIEAIQRLAEMNPTARPNLGWRGYGGVDPSSNALNGTWKLLFTDAADATFKKGRRGAATTFQEIDAAKGWFVNAVDFSDPASKLRGFRVFVEGESAGDKEMLLSFRKVRLLRRSRFPRLFGEINIPLPSPKFLRTIGRFFARVKGGEVNPSDRGAGFELLYVDKDLRVHRTFDGLYFVQRRLA